MQSFDVLIAGGGAVGATLALALAQQTDLRIGLVEASVADTQQHPGFDARVVALAAQSWAFLQSLGVTPEHTPIERIHVSDRGHLGQCQLYADEYGLDALGQVVALTDLGSSLEGALSKFRQVQWLRPARIQQCALNAEQVQITLDNQSEISAKLLVIAEGANSPTAALLGVVPERDDYAQVALVANVKTNQPHQGRAFERFTDSGPLALLPFGDRGYSLVWSLTPDVAQAMLEACSSRFLAKLQQAFGYRAGMFTEHSQRFSYPLALTQLAQNHGHRWLALGNANTGLHPIAGQGLNLGLRDVQGLVSAMQQQSADPGVFGVIQHFLQHREIDRATTRTYTDALVRLFSNQHVPFVVGRNLGLLSLSLLPALKRPLAQQSLGWAGMNSGQMSR